MKRTTKEIIFTEFGGKLPPQAQDLEKAVLGAILVDADAILLVTSIINAGMFYNDKHVKIYSCMEEMVSKSEAIDILTVTNKLRTKGFLDQVGGAFYITSLTDVVATSANIEFHARIVAQKYIARKVIEHCSRAMSQAYSDEMDIFEVVDGLGNGLVEINDVMNGANEIDWRKETEKQVMEIHKNSVNGITSTGLKTGLVDFDSAIAGIRPGFIVVGGRPAMGKTAFGLDLVCRILEETNGYVGVFSLEMPKSQLINRILARESEINQTKLLNSNINAVERQQLIRAGGRVSDMKILLNDNPSISILQIQSQAKVWANKYDLKAIFIDYIQLASGNSGYQRRDLEIAQISRGCKILSKILDIPVFGLAQLGREKDSGKSMPQLSELRESGCLDGDTLIQVPKHKKTYRIKDLVYQKKFDIFATDYNKTKEMEAKKAFLSGIKEVFEMQLLNYQKISATGNHKFLTPFGWKPLSELQIDDKIAIPINYGDVNDDKNINEISLIGHFLANGSALSRKPIRYSQNILDSDLTDIVINDAKLATENRVVPYFKDTILEKSKFRTIFFKPTFHLTHGKTSPIADIMRKYGLWDKRAKDKFIPDELFYLSHKSTCILLKSLFSGDGNAYYVEKNGRKSLKISYSSCSEKLILGVQQLLSKIGIVSFISPLVNKKNQSWFNLFIAGKSNIELYVKNIGFWNKRKHDILIDGWEKSKNNLAGWNKYDFNETRGLCFMPVKSIVSIGTKEVFDIEVPELHNFVANNIIVHNSIEQDADTVLLLYRPEYYGIEFDANNQSTRGLTKVIIAKNRNGSVHIGGVNVRTRLDINKYYDWDTFGEMTEIIPELKPIDMRNIRQQNDEDLPF